MHWLFQKKQLQEDIQRLTDINIEFLNSLEDEQDIQDIQAEVVMYNEAFAD